MILDHPFKIGQNSFETELNYNLLSIRGFSALAEFDAKRIEQESNDLANCKLTVNVDFFIKNRTELYNFQDQVSKLKKNISNLTNFNSAVVLAGRTIQLERDMFHPLQNVYKLALEEFENLMVLIYQYNSIKLKCLKIQFIDKKNSVADNCHLRGDYLKPFLLDNIKGCTKHLLNKYQLLLIEIFQKAIPRTEFSPNNIKEVIEYLKSVITTEVDKITRASVASKLHKYSESNVIFKKEKKIDARKLSSDEARLIYFMNCIFKLDSIIEKEILVINRKEIKKTSIVNHNDLIINRIKKAFIHSSSNYNHKIIEYSVSNDNDIEIFELLKNAIKK